MNRTSNTGSNPRIPDEEIQEIKSKLEQAINSGFHEDQKKEIIKIILITDLAKEIGKLFAKSRNNKISSAQLRKFFNDIRAIEVKAEAVGDRDFNKILHLVKMLKAKVAYSKGRRNVSGFFKEFIDICIEKIEDRKDFDAFVKFFEAIVGYFYYYEGGK